MAPECPTYIGAGRQLATLISVMCCACASAKSSPVTPEARLRSEHRAHMRQYGHAERPPARVLHSVGTKRHHHHGHMRGRFRDAKRWSARFDAPSRATWQRPEILLNALTLRQGDRVADIGAGTGYFSVRIARRVRSGRVYAVDVEPSMVSWLKDRAHSEGLAHLVPVLGAAQSPRLPEPVDLVFVCNTYHHIANPKSYFGRLRSQIRPGGRLVVVDFRLGDLPVGPPDAHKVSPQRAADTLRLAGWELVRRDETTLPYQYVLTLRPRLGAETGG